ncbi:MAG: hypothetical protein JNK40_12250 [Chromatiales bacterium]|nr:hypothetical protein [Chromatiales bacterium]
MQDGVTGYELLQFLHVFLFVFWLGPDVAVYVWSRKTVEAGASAEQRIVAGQMMTLVDFIPRAAISLMLTVGGLLSEYVGLEHSWWQMAGIILLGPVWLALVLAGIVRDRTPFGATARRLETWLRWALIIVVPLSVAYSTLTGRLAIAPYVGAKLLLFAAILLFGQLLRARLAPLRQGLADLAASGPSPAVDEAMRRSLASSRPYTVAIWAAILVAALMGVVKPGAPSEGSPDSATLRFDQAIGAPNN